MGVHDARRAERTDEGRSRSLRSAKVFLKGEAKEAYRLLKQQAGQEISFAHQLLRSIDQKISILKQNPFYGNNIPKRLIPKSYHVQNLWRIPLTGYWRMLYTVRNTEVDILCFILEILDHKRYDKLFRYGKK